MRNYLAITKRELSSLFVSPIAYVVLAVFFALSGYFFTLILENIMNFAMQRMVQSQQFGTPPPPFDAPAAVIRGFLGFMSTMLLFLVPMITMGTMAEERKRGTIELLLTSPITPVQLILGKFTALSLFLLTMLGPSILYSVFLYFFSQPPPLMAPILVGYLGAFLLGETLIAVGIFISSLTENQIVAAVVTFGTFLVLWVLDAAAGASSTMTNEVMRYLSVLNHYNDFTVGVLDTQHVVFYLSFVFLGLFLTSVSLGSAKWRQ